MGTITRYELKKLLGGRFFLVALCLLLAVDMLLNCGIQDYLETRKELESGGAWGAPGESVGFWESRAAIRRIVDLQREQYALFAELTEEETAAFEEAMREKYGEDVFDIVLFPGADMLAVPGYFGGSRSDFDYIMDYQTLTQWNRDMREARERVVRAAQQFGREALEDGDDYGVRRNRNIILRYRIPHRSATAPIRGWSVFLFENHAMLLVFLMVLLVCAGNVARENDGRTWLLLHTAKNGKGKTLAAKYLAGIIAAAGFTILFQLAALGAVWFQGGLVGAKQPAAVMEQLRLFPYNGTVGQYALLALAFQMFTAVVLSVLLTTVSALSRSGVISYAIGAVLLGGCVLMLYFPPKSEWLAGPLSLSRPLKYFESYYTANLFGFPVLWAVVQAVLWCLLGAGCILLARKVYHRKREAV